MLILLKCIADSHPDKDFQFVDKPTILLILFLRLRRSGLLRIFGDDFVVHFLDVKGCEIWDFVF